MKKEIAFKAEWWDILKRNFPDPNSIVKVTDAVIATLRTGWRQNLKVRFEQAEETAYDFILDDIERDRKKEEAARMAFMKEWTTHTAPLLFKPQTGPEEELEYYFYD